MFIKLTNMEGQKIRVNTDHLVEYRPDSADKGSIVFLNNFPTGVIVSESATEIDLKIEQVTGWAVGGAH